MMYFLIFVIRTFLKQDKEIAIYTSLDNFERDLIWLIQITHNLTNYQESKKN